MASAGSLHVHHAVPCVMCNMMQAEHMQLVKEAFMERDAMAVIVGLVAEPLSRHPRMSEADGLVVQLVITFIRNLLVIPDRAATAGHTAIWQLTPKLEHHPLEHSHKQHCWNSSRMMLPVLLGNQPLHCCINYYAPATYVAVVK